jgi:L-amino acid N-acyltransferase YncA
MIREANLDDLECIVVIYNQAIKAKFQTAFTQAFKTEERLLWFHQHSSAYPLFVYEIDGKVAGWLSVIPYRKGRQALQRTIEISYFVDDKHRRMGIGHALLAHAIEFSTGRCYTNVLAIVLDRNMESVGLLKKCGFEQWGYLPGIANFDGEECGQLYFGRRLYG